MTLAEYARLDFLVGQLFRGGRRPAAGDALAAHLRINYPAWQDIDLLQAVQALYVLKLEGAVWEPTPGDVRSVIATSRGADDSYIEGMKRLREAVEAWRDACTSGSKLPTEFVQQPDGSFAVVRGSASPRWKEAAGEVVLEWLEIRGGISIAAELIDTPTYQAQFRDWWKERSRRSVREAAVAAAEAIVLPADVAAALGPGAGMRELPADHGQHDEEGGRD
jgi:hypothetical protein